MICPECGGDLKLEGDFLICRDCGWETDHDWDGSY